EGAMAASRRILVIEDDVDGVEALCALLGQWGHRVSSAKTGGRGIEIALLEAPEVIILDLGLGDMDGCDVIRRIRSERRNGTPWIIAYSGYHDREDEARRAGCDAFVVKPALEELESSVNAAWISGHDSHQGPLAVQTSRRRRGDVA